LEFQFRFGENEMIRKCRHAYATTKGLTGRFAFFANRRWEGRAAELFKYCFGKLRCPKSVCVKRCA
jgi:hypothetical protein